MRPLRVLAAAAVSFVFSFASSAQESPPAAPQQTDERAELKGIEEIIVTAERREQNLQDVAQTISAFSFDSLTEGNIQDAYDLQLKVPGLVATGGLPAITLRGLGQDTDVLGSGGVSVRASVRYVPTESVTFDLIGAWTKDNDDGGTWRPLEPYPTFPAGQSLLFGSVDYSAATPLPSDPRKHRANRTHKQFYETYWGQAILAVEIPTTSSSSTRTTSTGTTRSISTRTSPTSTRSASCCSTSTRRGRARPRCARATRATAGWAA